MTNRPVGTSATVVRGLLMAIATLATSPLAAQPTSGEVQPDHIEFGHVCLGATVEGSIRLFEKGDTTEGVDVDLQAPPFVTIIDQKLGTQKYGNSGTFVTFDVVLSIKTTMKGLNSGALKITLGRSNVEVPISAVVLPPRPDAIRALVVETPFDKYSTDDGTMFIPWLNLVDAIGLNVDYWDVSDDRPTLRDHDLSEFDVILLGETGLYRHQEADLARLKQFVAGGGRVVVAANAFYVGSVEAANNILAWGGLKMTDTEPRESGVISLQGDNLIDHPLMAEIRMVKCHRPSPIAVADKVAATILVAAPQYPGEGYIALGRYEKGEIIALGQSLWWNWMTQKESDNAALMQSLLSRKRTSE